MLLGNYILMGTLLSRGDYSGPTIGFLIGGSFMIALMYLHPITDLSKLIRRWFSSDAIAFCSFVLIAIAVSILLNWFRLFVPVMMIMTTEGLARLDLQANEYTEWQTFFILVAITAVGLAFGWTCGRLI
jgi:hypothetical protein